MIPLEIVLGKSQEGVDHLVTSGFGQVRAGLDHVDPLPDCVAGTIRNDQDVHRVGISEIEHPEWLQNFSQENPL